MHEEAREEAEAERWRPRQLRDGTDPDPRFTLANERTLLAWLRTSMALIAGAVSLEAFVSDAIPRGIRMPLAVLLLIIAAALALYSFRRWLRMESAMRRGRPTSSCTASPRRSRSPGRRSVAGTFSLSRGTRHSPPTNICDRPAPRRRPSRSSSRPMLPL